MLGARSAIIRTRRDNVTTDAIRQKNSLTFEVLNAVIHGIAVVLSIIALVALIFKGIKQGSAKDIVAYSIYGACMILMFLNSTLYHSFTFTRFRPIFQKLDHAAIYLMIAGSYTPYLVIALDFWFQYPMLVLIWIIALLGIVFEFRQINKYPRLSLVLYLGMGWLSILIIRPLVRALDPGAIILLFLGGLAYTIGTLFYRQKSKKWTHFVWHVFVLLGATFMYFSIYLYV